MNVHIRCEQNVAPNCGVNSAELASKLAEIGLEAGRLSKRGSQVRYGLYCEKDSYRKTMKPNTLSLFAFSTVKHVLGKVVKF